MSIKESIRNEFSRAPVSTVCQIIVTIVVLIPLVIAVTHPKTTISLVQNIIESAQHAELNNNVELANKPSDNKVIADAKQLGKQSITQKSYKTEIANISIEGITSQQSNAQAYVKMQYTVTENYKDNSLILPTSHKKGDIIQEKYQIDYIKTDRNWMFNKAEERY